MNQVWVYEQWAVFHLTLFLDICVINLIQGHHILKAGTTVKKLIIAPNHLLCRRVFVFNEIFIGRVHLFLFCLVFHGADQLREHVESDV